MTAMRTIGLTGTLCALGLASILNAAVPTTRTAVTPGIINYQGMLLNPAGTPYSNGVYTLEFRIYDSETAVNAGLWAASYPVYVKGGYFNVMLGGSGGASVIPTPLFGVSDLWRALWFDSASSAPNTRYLGVTVKSGPDASLPENPLEAFPRQRFLSAPFAERAQMAQVARAAMDTFTVPSTLTVSGLISGTAGITVSGAASLANLTVSGSATLNNGLTVNTAAATFNKGLTSQGAVTYVKNGLDVVGAATMNGGVNAVNSKIQENSSDLIPRGVIVMWSGSTAPAGWALCNGANGTPDLRGRFVLGLGAGSGLTSRTLAQTGGEENHTLTSYEMPYHEHDFNVGTVGFAAAWNGSSEATRAPGQSRNNGWQTQNTGHAGSGGAHNTMPPYYVLAYIMKL